MKKKSKAKRPAVSHRAGFYAIELDDFEPKENFERIMSERILVVLRNGMKLRLSLTEERPALEVYTTDGQLVVYPCATNVTTVGVEGH